MTFAQKLVLGTAALLLAGAAAFPQELAGLYQNAYPTDARKRDALAQCQLTTPSFIRFLPGDREECYARMRVASGEHGGTWSKPLHDPVRLAQASR